MTPRAHSPVSGVQARPGASWRKGVVAVASLVIFLVALLAPLGTAQGGTYWGDGHQGPIVRNVDTNEDALVQATTYRIDPGVVVTTTNAECGGILIHATQAIHIEGTLHAIGKGQPGGSADTNGADGYGGGGATGPSSGGLQTPPGGAGGSRAPLERSLQLLDAFGTSCMGRTGAGGAGGRTANALAGGGGGGAGATQAGGSGGPGLNEGATVGTPGRGASGGGFLVLVAPLITLGTNAVVSVNGTGGEASTGNSGAGGGGAGGTILLVAQTLVINGSRDAHVWATGGRGGDAAGAGEAGGPGGLPGRPGGHAVGSRGGGGGAGGEIIERVGSHAVQPLVETVQAWRVTDFVWLLWVVYAFLVLRVPGQTPGMILLVPGYVAAFLHPVDSLQFDMMVLLQFCLTAWVLWGRKPQETQGGT